MKLREVFRMKCKNILNSPHLGGGDQVGSFSIIALNSNELIILLGKEYGYFNFLLLYVG